MKIRNKLQYIVLLLWILVFAFGCKNKNDNKIKISTNNDSTNISNISPLENFNILEHNTQRVIIDTFENGNPMKIHFIDKNDTSITYEKQFYKSGKLFIEGKLINSKRDSLWTAFYENGKVWSIGYFSKGLRHGESKVYYKNGNIRFTKYYDNDIPVGTWLFYNEHGDIEGELKYENGKIVEKSGIFEEAK